MKVLAASFDMFRGDYWEMLGRVTSEKRWSVKAWTGKTFRHRALEDRSSAVESTLEDRRAKSVGADERKRLKGRKGRKGMRINSDWS